PLSYSIDPPPTTELYTLSLHDALPIWIDRRHEDHVGVVEGVLKLVHQRLKPGVAVRLHDRDHPFLRSLASCSEDRANLGRMMGRSEEHTSELQSRSDLVCRLLLEKKKK